MQVTLLAVGRRMPAWVEAGFTEYAKRVSGSVRLELKTVATGRRGKGANPANPKQVEGQRLLEAVPRRSFIVALDSHGTPWSTADLARRMDEWMHQACDVALLVGGAEGLAGPCLQQAAQCWSLGALTFPHALVRVIVAEQIYRAWTLLSGHPYHRA